MHHDVVAAEGGLVVPRCVSPLEAVDHDDRLIDADRRGRRSCSLPLIPHTLSVEESA